jgi:AraC-like DNA-binding protein
MFPIFVAPLTTAGMTSWGKDAEILWIKFKLGVFMPHLPARNYLGVETYLPNGAGESFWLKSSTWQYPDYDNVETFINQLARQDVLVRDPIVDAALNDEPLDAAPRTIRHRFLRATGLTQSHIRQIERAQRAADLLRAGWSILDTVEAAGYFDQPHLTKALRQWVGYTPAQIVQSVRVTTLHALPDNRVEAAYDRGVVAAS